MSEFRFQLYEVMTIGDLRKMLAEYPDDKRIDIWTPEGLEDSLSIYDRDDGVVEIRLS